MWPEASKFAAKENSIWQFEAEEGILLPESYKKLILMQNGGLLQKNHLKTQEPTSYGLDFLEVYRLLGLEELITKIPFQDQNPLAGKKIYFSKDENRFLGFDYITTAPQIIYADFETLQVLTVAENFDAFLASLYHVPFNGEQLTNYSHDKLELMLLSRSANEQAVILEELEDDADKEWYFRQLKKLIEAGNEDITYRLFENQILYFKRKLPKETVNAFFSLFKNQTQALANLKKEWQDNY
ncbi:SMI1/KNR4 family protein [Listeria aquatica]|uniref:SMI1/KNR4 family protein n=1 Tax=Listeria aquatica TaxID=1494960 RepID=UPI003EF6C035